MARLILASALLFSVFALGATDNSRLLELLESLLDNGDLETRKLTFDQLNNKMTESAGVLKKAEEYFKPILLEAASGDSKFIDPICKKLIKDYKDEDSDFRKALVNYDTVYSDLRTKMGLTRSLDDDAAMEERVVRLRFLVDLAGREVERASVQPPTENSIDQNMKQIIKALNDVDNGVNGFLNDNPNKQSLDKTKRILGEFNTAALRIKSIIHYFGGFCF